MLDDVVALFVGRGLRRFGEGPLEARRGADVVDLAARGADEVVLVWAGLVVTYYSSFPVGFVITALAFAAYLIARAVPSATPAPYHRS